MTNIIDKCLEAGLRITNQRRIIVELIDSADDHPDVDTIYRRAIDIDDRGIIDSNQGSPHRDIEQD